MKSFLGNYSNWFFEKKYIILYGRFSIIINDLCDEKITFRNIFEKNFQQQLIPLKCYVIFRFFPVRSQFRTDENHSFIPFLFFTFFEKLKLAFARLRLKFSVHGRHSNASANKKRVYNHLARWFIMIADIHSRLRVVIRRLVCELSVEHRHCMKLHVKETSIH